MPLRQSTPVRRDNRSTSDSPGKSLSRQRGCNYHSAFSTSGTNRDLLHCLAGVASVSCIIVAKNRFMTDRIDPFDEGCRAASEGIPAEANPYPKEAAESVLWKDGHESVASAIEASQSEGDCFAS